MTATTPVERVAKLLEEAGFTRMPTPLEIGGIEIEAAAAFVGKPPLSDLIVVGDTLTQTPRGLHQSIEGVGRALDMMGSRRPLTLVVVGPRPESSILTSLSRYARVLAVGEQADESTLSNWLAVLLPLKLPATENDRAYAANDKLLTGASDPLVREFVELASHGQERVAARLAAAVDEPFAEANNNSQRRRK
jgi:hypothetical protein